MKQIYRSNFSFSKITIFVFWVAIFGSIYALSIILGRLTLEPLNKGLGVLLIGRWPCIDEAFSLNRRYLE